MFGSPKNAEREAAQEKYRQGVTKMREILKPLGSVPVDFASMTVVRGVFEYHLAYSYRAARRRWFVRLQRATQGSTTRSGEEYARALLAGRLDEEELEREEARLAAWLREDRSRSENDWRERYNLFRLRDAVEERKESAGKERSPLDLADDNVRRMKYVEWVKVPARDDGWIDAKYDRVREFFSDHQLHEPGLTLEAFLAEPRARCWKPPVHADNDTILASWAKVVAAKQALVEAMLGDGRWTRDKAVALVEEHAAPWEVSDD